MLFYIRRDLDYKTSKQLRNHWVAILKLAFAVEAVEPPHVQGFYFKRVQRGKDGKNRKF